MAPKIGPLFRHCQGAAARCFATDERAAVAGRMGFRYKIHVCSARIAPSDPKEAKLTQRCVNSLQPHKGTPHLHSKTSACVSQKRRKRHVHMTQNTHSLVLVLAGSRQHVHKNMMRRCHTANSKANLPRTAGIRDRGTCANTVLSLLPCPPRAV